MKIATFKSSYGLETIYSEDAAKHSNNAVRTSAWIEVEFPPLTEEDRAERAAQIERARQNEIQLHQRRMQELQAELV